MSLADRVTESEKPAMTDVTCAVGVDVPADVRALCILPSIDYIDLFTGTPVPQATAETWGPPPLAPRDLPPANPFFLEA